MQTLALICIGLKVRHNGDETLKQVQGNDILVQVIGIIITYMDKWKRK